MGGLSEQPPTEEPRRTLCEELLVAIEQPDLRAVSFDCFDTLLMRSVPRPTEAFLLAHARSSDETPTLRAIGPLRYHNLRVQAESEARRRLAEATGSVEVTIQEIYDAFPAWIPRDERQRALEFEIEVQRQLIRPVAWVADAVRVANERGLRVVITSDTYYPRPLLEEFLGENLMARVDVVFCSCEYRTGKGEGLFLAALERLKIEAEQLLHVGDNYHADMVSAARHGIRSFILPNGDARFWEIAERESRLRGEDRLQHLDPRYGDFGLTSLRAKIPARGAGGGSFTHFEYGAQILGPLFAGFCVWVRQSMEAHRLDTAVFAYREGEFLLALVDRMFPDADNGRVLYTSRRIVLQAQAADLTPERVTEMIMGRQPPTAWQLAEMLGIEGEDAASIDEFASEKLMSAEDVAPFLEALRQDTRLWNRARARLSQARDGLLDQLEEIRRRATKANGGRMRVGYVDLGWSGTAQRQLQAILDQSELEIDLVGLYLMTEPAVDRPDGHIETYGYLVDAGAGYPYSADEIRTRDVIEIIEQAAMAPTGSAIGFTNSGEPYMAESLCPPKQRREIELIQQGIIKFTDAWRLHADDVDAGDRTLRRNLGRIYERAMLAPSPVEAALFKDWVHDDNLRHVTESIIPDDFVEQASHMSVRQFVSASRGRVYWLGGAAGLAGPWLAELHQASAVGAVDQEVEAQGAVCECVATIVWAGGTRAVTVPVTRNHAGLSFLSIEEEGDGILSIDIRWRVAMALIRFDQLTVSTRSADCPEIRHTCLRGEQITSELGFVAERDLGMGLLSVSPESELMIRLSRLNLQPANWARIELGFLVLEVPRRLSGTGALPADSEPAADLVAAGPSADDAAEACRRLEQELATRNAEISELRRSWSWRLTAPMRWVLARLLRHSS